MKEPKPKLHDIAQYRRNDAILYGLKSLGRTGCAMLAFGFGAYSIDLGYTLATEPDRNSTMRWYGNTDCKDAEFVAAHLSSTGKDIAEYQASNNQQAIERAGGAILLTGYDTKGDIAEFRDHLDETLAECARPDRPYVPVVLNGVSLGGKYAQWVTNARLKNGIVMAIIMESTLTGPDSLQSGITRSFIKTASSGTTIPATKGMVFMNALGTEISRRGMDIFTNEYAIPDVLASTEQTNAKTLTWQFVANAQPWPIAVRPGDNSVPIEYIYSDGDNVVDTTVARAQLKLFTRAEVTEHRISREESWPEAPSHGDGWRRDATNWAEYRTTYTNIYQKYRKMIDQRKQAIADTSIYRATGGPI